MARRHWLFGSLFAVGLVLRAGAWIAYRPALVYIDSPRYLGNDAHGLDPLGYSYLLLRPVLLAGGGLAGVAAVQHVAGLAMAGCLYALAIRHGTRRWLAALAAAPVLLDAYQVQAEQMIMPDVLFEALIVAAMAVLLWRADQAGPGLTRLACGAALLGLSATVRQIGEVLAMPLLAYVLAAPLSAASGWPRLARAGRKARLVLAYRPAGLRHRASRVRRAAWPVAALAVFALPVVGYMAFSAAVLGNGFRLSNMDDAYLYGRLAHAADCATLRVPGYERPFCPPPATAAALGVDGLATDPASAVFRYTPPRGISRGTAARRFDEAVLTQQPLRVAGDVARDAVKVFALTRDTAPGDPPVSRWQFQLSYPVYYAVDYAAFGSLSPQVIVPVARALRSYQLHGGFTPGPLLLCLLLLGTGGVFARRRQPALAQGCLFVTGLAVAALLGADLYEFSWRYQLPALITLPLAGALGATALLRALPSRWHKPAGVTRWPGRQGTMIRCILTGRIKPIRRSGRSPAASSTPTTGSGSAKTTSSAATDPAAPTRS
jgi:hypothetical protein